ncbi:uncharacterized protein [Lepeophtheirus salmonis]|uniref:Uncharacterized protein n=1 Tax=Lepeophtheirus salmonis TaxID=72036 RepID=A0A0K2U052_LEPSM|nr:uncharacterized protein LOC121117973 [Lepeophtheirus salmonis]
MEIQKIIVLSVVSLTCVTGDCFFEGRRICENSISKHPFTGIVRHCKDGVLRVEVESDVRGRFDARYDCDWYGLRYCHEDTINGLIPWWFFTKCRDGIVKIFPKPPITAEEAPK